jgi:hypothetical protein
VSEALENTQWLFFGLIGFGIWHNCVDFFENDWFGSVARGAFDCNCSEPLKSDRTEGVPWYVVAFLVGSELDPTEQTRHP